MYETKIPELKDTDMQTLGIVIQHQVETGEPLRVEGNRNGLGRPRGKVGKNRPERVSANSLYRLSANGLLNVCTVSVSSWKNSSWTGLHPHRVYTEAYLSEKGERFMQGKA